MPTISTTAELQAAIATNGTAPGTTVHLAPGTYSGPFTSNVVGTQAAPIVFQGESGVIIDGELTINGADTTWRNIEFTYSGWTTRVSAQTGSDPTDIPDNTDFDVFGARTKLINCVIHDLPGFGHWSTAGGSETYGCLFYNMGWDAPDRGHGHSIYTQNAGTTKLFESNVILPSYSDYGIHQYSSGGGLLQNYTWRKNVHIGRNWLSGGAQPVSGLTIDQNVIYQNIMYVGHPLAGAAANLDAAVTDNVLVSTTLIATDILTLTGSGNVFQQSSDQCRVTPRTGYSYSWSNNSYYVPFASAANQFQWNGVSMNFATWKSTTGLDATSTTTLNSNGPTTPILVPNTYDGGRAIVVVRNWASASTVSVDFSSLNLSLGATYKLRNAANYYGDTPHSFVYSGAAVSVPMTGWTVAAPTAAAAALYSSTFPTFGVFLLELQNGVIATPTLSLGLATQGTVSSQVVTQGTLTTG